MVLLVISVCLNIYSTTSLAQTAEQPAQSVLEEEAERIYSNLSSLSIRDRKEFYRGLTPELKSELWKVQLRSYLSTHPDLTDKQRQAIEFAIAFINPQIFDIPQDSPEWEEKVNKPIQVLDNKVLEVFPREVARELLTVLGGSESPLSLKVRSIYSIPGLTNDDCTSTRQEPNLLLAKKKIKTQQQAVKIISASFKTEDCDCSTRSDWCQEGTQCLAESCQVQQGCGTFFLYICNGLCIYLPCSC